MTHAKTLGRIYSHLDDLKARNPAKYREEERNLELMERRLGNEVATSPTRSPDSPPPYMIKRFERRA